MGIANRPETGLDQPQSYHGVAALLPSSSQYIISFDYDLYSWDSYIAPTEAGRGYWDSFQVSVSSQPIWQASLYDPITPKNLPGLGFIWGGSKWGDHVLKHVSGSRTVVVNGDPSGNNYLNVVLDTASAPATDPLYPSWGTITIKGVETDSNLATLSDQAAALAKTVVGGQYLWGGKGWNWTNPREYVSTQKILNDGYYYYKAATKSIEWGKGLDCSGLVYWSYDRVAGSTQYPGYPIFEEGAQGQLDRNTTPIVNKQDLRPGDLIFFGTSQQSITHVAMYVGGSDPTRNVVEARSESVGIVYSSLDQRVDNNPLFQDFGRVRLSQPAFIVQSHSPVTLIVTDPDGFTVSSDTYAFTGEEYIRGIPGVLYYTTDEQGDDIVYAPVLKPGIYKIQAVPKTDADPNDTFGLEVLGAAKLIDLAQNTRISDIPPEGYRVTATDAEINPSAHKVYLPLIARILDATPTDTYEPNNTIAQAYGPLASGTTYISYLSSNTDLDYYYFDISTLGQVTIDLSNIGAPSSDYDLELYDASGQFLGGSWGTTATEQIKFQPVSTGRYYILVFPYSGADPARPYYLKAQYNGALGAGDIFGTVYGNGSPKPNVPIRLNFYDYNTYAYWTVWGMTNSSGQYHFRGMSTLGPNQVYYVYYNGNLGPTYIGYWYSGDLASYTAGSTVTAGNLDISPLNLGTPNSTTGMPLPITFTWTPRTTSPSETYQVYLYDPNNYNIYYWTSDLGHVGNFTLYGLPSGFTTGHTYRWGVDAYGPDGSAGGSYYVNNVAFSSTGVTVYSAPVPRDRTWREWLPPERNKQDAKPARP